MSQDQPGCSLAEPPAAAASLFGENLPAMVRYAEFLAGPGVERGLIGPREVERLWERHLLNCGAAAELIPDGSQVVDVGSGGGLPGLVLAIARPDLTMILLEPLLRRTVFLSECVEKLELSNVEVRRGRAEEWTGGKLAAEVVTARAVAPLEKLIGWCLPLLAPNGRMLALKGETAVAELDAVAPSLPRLGAVDWAVVEVGSALGEAATRVVRIDMGAQGYRLGKAARPARRDRAARSRRTTR
ncbi:MAG TPA: 16S rRNA (guanine(527)-N(7))-methyltransferase RsmG [Pseudonocardia sp.]|jgi:16S rRNA (guanine527-N7)-methyltransferase|nr:16S rRNA (guanine(527)-N(7))-methyltransferase RsmG [Pseudonocardia sp.]